MISKLLYLISINYFFVIENTFVLTCDLLEIGRAHV